MPFPNPAPPVQGIAGSGADGLLGADPGAARLGVQVADSALAACMQQCAVQAGAEASKKAADGSGGDVAQQHAKKCLAACLPYANVYRGGNAALGWHSGMPVPLYGDDAAKKAGDFAKEEKPRPILANAAYAAHAVCVTNCVKAAKGRLFKQPTDIQQATRQQLSATRFRHDPRPGTRRASIGPTALSPQWFVLPWNVRSRYQGLLRTTSTELYRRPVLD